MCGQDEDQRFPAFRPIMKHLAENRFAADTDVKQDVASSLQTLNRNFFYAGIQALMPRWERRLNVSGEYVAI